MGAYDVSSIEKLRRSLWMISVVINPISLHFLSCVLLIPYFHFPPGGTSHVSYLQHVRICTLLTFTCFRARKAFHILNTKLVLLRAIEVLQAGCTSSISRSYSFFLSHFSWVLRQYLAFYDTRITQHGSNFAIEI